MDRYKTTILTLVTKYTNVIFRSAVSLLAAQLFCAFQILLIYFAMEFKKLLDISAVCLLFQPFVYHLISCFVINFLTIR